jgi:hypothetical protein
MERVMVRSTTVKIVSDLEAEYGISLTNIWNGCSTIRLLHVS